MGLESGCGRFSLAPIQRRRRRLGREDGRIAGGCSVMNGLIRPCRQRHKEQAPDRYFVGRDELREMA